MHLHIAMLNDVNVKTMLIDSSNAMKTEETRQSLSRMYAEARDQQELRIKGQPANPDLPGKWLLQ